MTARDALKAYEFGLNQHRFDAVTELIAPDAVFWFSDSNHRGIDSIRKACEDTWRALADDTYWLDQFEWVVETSDAAVCIYRFNWKSVIDGRPEGGSGRGTSVLRRIGDRWKIVHEHLSADPA